MKEKRLLSETTSMFAKISSAIAVSCQSESQADEDHTIKRRRRHFPYRINNIIFFSNIHPITKFYQKNNVTNSA